MAEPDTAHVPDGVPCSMPESRPRRRNSAPRRRNRPQQRRHEHQPTKPDHKSVLERALDATVDAPGEGLPDTFAAAGLPDRLVEALTRAGLTVPFPIQARTLRDGLAGRDVLGRAQTGSGKTLAFGLPMLATLAGISRPAARRPHGLVLVPTRELAQQVTSVLEPFGRAVGVQLAAVYGGAPMGKQITALRRGVGLVVATPGRLLDLVGRGVCQLDRASVTVLDEADYMADLGFLPAVTELLEQTAPDAQRMLFSATLDRGVDGLVNKFLTDPALHAVADAAAPVESVTHRVFMVTSEDKLPVAAEVAGRPGRSLFFVRTKRGADRLATRFGQFGIAASAIHGDRSQPQRARALAGFTAGSPRVLVATDVAARGIHVDDVDLVVHYDPPADHKDYLHRSGRTARAGAEGTVLSLVQPAERRFVTQLHSDAQVDADVVNVRPGDDTVDELATSGVPVIVKQPPAAERPTRRNNSRRPRRPTKPRRGNRTDA
ncbi:MAG: DEAD/DEAH box helicase [Streptosporangiales bacterium]|nr:DEAD/DEAH box helicase [Streptosporangiales bacterium]